MKGNMAVRLKPTQPVLRFSLQTPPVGLRGIRFAHGLSPDLLQEHPTTIHREVLPGDTSSLRSFRKLKEWLDECVEAHRRCPNISDLGQLPSRVLAIQGDIGSPQVQLLETQQQKGRYVCLSHCWGKIKPSCITYRSTLELNKRGIPWNTLPKTFQDVIQLVRRLEID